MKTISNTVKANVLLSMGSMLTDENPTVGTGNVFIRHTGKGHKIVTKPGDVMKLTKQK